MRKFILASLIAATTLTAASVANAQVVYWPRPIVVSPPIIVAPLPPPVIVYPPLCTPYGCS